MGVAALDDVLLDELELGVVLVDLVFLDTIGKSTDNEEMAVSNADATVPYCENLMLVMKVAIEESP